MGPLALVVWALMGQVLVGLPPWAIMGQTLVGPCALMGRALVGPPGPFWAGPSRGPWQGGHHHFGRGVSS